ncbi:MAG: YihY/virulence factor BrkB family protein [Candidatus Levyibacteriota bacterium]
MNYINVVKDAFSGWSNDKASVWAASLAYVTIFSLSPLLLLLTAIVGIFLGEKAVQGQLFDQLKGIMGPDAASLIQKGVSHTTKPSGNIIATIIGIITLILGASGVFGQLQQAFNAIWKVKTSPKAGIKALIIDRLLSFSMLLIIAFLLVISVGLSFITDAATNYVNGFFNIPLPLIEGINLILSFIVLVFLFGAMFKVLPDIEIPFRSVLPGAILTALLFVIGKFVLAWYIGRSAYTTTYGAAGSLMVILVWVYYSIQLLLLGAEFTRAYVYAKAIKVVPSRNAISTAPDHNIIKVKEATDKEKAATIGGFVAIGMLSRLMMYLLPKPKTKKV